MSTTAADRPTQTPPTQTPPTAGPAGPTGPTGPTGPVPTVTRTSIFPKGAFPAPTATLPAVTLPTAAGADWRGRAQTEGLPAVPAPHRKAPRRPSRRTRARRHLRSALIGTLLAIVAITGLSAYAAAGITDARSTALCQAHVSCR